MMPNTIEFDVVVPVFNAEATLESCLRSVLSQTYQNFHLYVVIDGATDRSGAVAQCVLANDPRSTIIEQQNGGAAAARNRGASEGKNRYIAFLDADDEWLPNHLATLELLIRSSRPDGMYATAHRIASPAVDLVAAGTRVQTDFPYFRASLSGFYPVWIGACAVSRRCFEDVGGFSVPVNPRQCGEDVEFMMRVACRYPVAYLQDVTSIYHWNPRGGSGPHNTPWDGYLWHKGMEILRGETLRGTVRRDLTKFVVRCGMSTIGALILKGDRRNALSLLFACRPYHMYALRRIYWMGMCCLPSKIACRAYALTKRLMMVSGRGWRKSRAHYRDFGLLARS
jgi:glycosyltransferase involved in cell wall biosynthesis